MLPTCYSYFLVCSEYHREKSTSDKSADSNEVREAPLDLRAAGLWRVFNNSDRPTFIWNYRYRCFELATSAFKYWWAYYIQTELF